MCNTRISTNIKNLAIALEHLSQVKDINHGLNFQIVQLLQEEIKVAQKENHPPREPYTKTDNDDDIPF